jgi:hypothetical protein
VCEREPLGNNTANAAGLGMGRVKFVKITSANVNEYGRFQCFNAFAGRHLFHEAVSGMEEAAFAGKPVGDVAEIALALKTSSIFSRIVSKRLRSPPDTSADAQPE